MGVVDIDVHVLKHLKEELAWPADKRLWVISTSYNVILKTVIHYK